MCRYMYINNIYSRVHNVFLDYREEVAFWHFGRIYVHYSKSGFSIVIRSIFIIFFIFVP